MHFFLFLVIVFAVSGVNALIRPVPVKQTAREALKMFFTTVVGMGAVALIIHLASI